MKFIYFYLAFLLSVLIHEFGHYFWCKKFGVRVHSFTVGFGPAFIKRKINNTTFSLRLIPLVGAVTQEETDVRKLSIAKNLIIMLAGVFNNFILFILSLIIIAKFNIVKIFYFLFYTLIPSAIKLFTNINNYVGPDNSMNHVYEQLSISGLREALMLFASLNFILFIFNLLPIPVLDGGQVILLLLQRFLLRFGISKDSFDKIANPLCWISFIGLFLLSIINEILSSRETLLSIIYIIMAALIVALIFVFKQTNFYKQHLKKE